MSTSLDSTAPVGCDDPCLAAAAMPRRACEAPHDPTNAHAAAKGSLLGALWLLPRRRRIDPFSRPANVAILGEEEWRRYGIQPRQPTEGVPGLRRGRGKQRRSRVWIIPDGRDCFTPRPTVLRAATRDAQTHSHTAQIMGLTVPQMLSKLGHRSGNSPMVDERCSKLYNGHGLANLCAW